MAIKLFKLKLFFLLYGTTENLVEMSLGIEVINRNIK